MPTSTKLIWQRYCSLQYPSESVKLISKHGRGAGVQGVACIGMFMFGRGGGGDTFWAGGGACARGRVAKPGAEACVVRRGGMYTAL